MSEVVIEEIATESSVASLRDAIFSVDDRPIEKLFVPEWGVTIGVRALDGEARGKFAVSSQRDGEDSAMVFSTARVVALSACDPATGDQIFTDDDVVALGKKNAKALDLIAERVFILSGMRDEDRKEAEDQFRK